MRDEKVCMPTLGPWTINKYRNVLDSNGTIVQVCGVSSPIGHVPDGHVGYANARLLSAAPDLLEALELFMDMWNSGDSGRSSKRAQQRRADMWDKANAAIAKVKGESA